MNRIDTARSFSTGSLQNLFRLALPLGFAAVGFSTHLLQTHDNPRGSSSDSSPKINSILAQAAAASIDATANFASTNAEIDRFQGALEPCPMSLDKNEHLPTKTWRSLRACLFLIGAFGDTCFDIESEAGYSCPIIWNPAIAKFRKLYDATIQPKIEEGHLYLVRAHLVVHDNSDGLIQDASSSWALYEIEQVIETGNPTGWQRE